MSHECYEVEFVVEEAQIRVFRGRLPVRGQDNAEINPANSGERLCFVARELGPDALVSLGFAEVETGGEHPRRIVRVKHREVSGG